MPLRSAAPVTDNIQYHVVWIPKYRKMILDEEIAQELEKLLYGLAERSELTIEERAVAPDHVHLFLSAPPRYAPSVIMEKLKGMTATTLVQRFPSLRAVLWGGHVWSRGSDVGPSGDTVTNDLLRRYIQYQRMQEDQRGQGELF